MAAPTNFPFSAPAAESAVAPETERRLVRWKNAMAGLLRRDPEARWGAQLLRIASDMIVICDESLTILHHNRAFLKAVGHTSGSFQGLWLGDFFPSEERDGVSDAFGDWRRGHAAGMRFQAGLLTMKGRRPCEFRAVRSRNRDGSFLYYLVAREAVEAKTPGRPPAEGDTDPFFRGLPVAAWRTDGSLRITQAFGSLWPELGAASEDLVGERFGRRHDSLLPEALQAIDCSDALAGMSLQTELEREGTRYNVAVEPFLDASGGIVGTVGILRRAARPAPVPDRRETAPRSRVRHPSPAVASSLRIDIVTGRVPRFDEPDEDATQPVLPCETRRGATPGLPS